ncbi:MAG: MDR family MFS transporter [Pseudomonadota bacterium]|jgi:EmrB/QacA subfamily drug resistance transporter
MTDAAAQTADLHPQDYSPQQRRATLIALLIVLLLSALDQTIVTTAMPRVAAQLHGLDLYAWVTTAYLLASTVMVPIYGKLSDIYGRKPILVIGICIFLAGSWLCGLSGAFGDLFGGGMVQLIVFRALQGLGGGALFTSAFAVIADLFPPKERGKFAGLFGAVFGLASVLGPLLGGLFTDMGSTSLGPFVIDGWRWCFYVNLPLGALALFMVIARTPSLSVRQGGKIDFLGAGLIVVATVPLMLALSNLGRGAPLDSPFVGPLLVLAAVGLVAFIFAELKVENPILSMALFTNKVFSLGNGVQFLIQMAFTGMLGFLPLYMQLGLGLPATVSGLTMLPVMLGLIFASALSGQVVARTGRYKPAMVAGLVGLCGAGLVLAGIGPDTSVLDLLWRMALLGVSVGPAQALFTIAIQNAVKPTEIGVVTSANQFFRQIGATLGVAVFGAVLTANLAGGGGSQKLSLEDLERMTVEAAAAPKHGATHVVDPRVKVQVAGAMRVLILAGFGVSLAALAGCAFIPELPMRSRVAPAAKPEAQGVAS